MRRLLLASITIGALSMSCHPSVVERLNFDGSDCRGTKTPITQVVAGKTLATCVDSRTADLMMCTQSFALASDGRARNDGIDTCRRRYEAAMRLEPDLNAIALSQKQQRAASYTTCMAGLEKLNLGEKELQMRGLLASVCMAMLEDPITAPVANKNPG